MVAEQQLPPVDTKAGFTASGTSGIQITPPKQWRNGLIAGIVLLVSGIFVGFVVARQFEPKQPVDEKSSSKEDKPEEHSGESVALSAEKQLSSSIEIHSTEKKPLHSFVWRTGRVALNDDQLAHICPSTEGVVRDVSVRLGQNVEAKQVLAVIESRELGQAKLEAYRAKIALAAEREQASRTRTTMSNAEELLRLVSAETPILEIEKKMTDKPIGDFRQQLLGAYTRRNQLRNLLLSQQTSVGAVSESNLRKTEAESEAASATYTSLLEELRFQVKNQVRQAELKLKDAETTFDVAKAKLILFGLSSEEIDVLNPIAEGANASLLMVKAPFAGTIVEKHAVRSERVNPLTQMFVVADLSTIWVQADLFEADLLMLRGITNQSIQFRSLAAGIKNQSAKVVYTGDLIDKSSRALTLTAEALNPERAIKPGMYVEIGFDTTDHKPVLQVPTTAVLRHENKPFVFVKTADDRFRRVEVTLGRTGKELLENHERDVVEITAGLKQGDRVVSNGGFVLKSELLKDQMVGE